MLGHVRLRITGVPLSLDLAIALPRLVCGNSYPTTISTTAAAANLSANGNGAASGGNDRTETMDRAVAAAAGMSLFVGMLIIFTRLAHLYGVMVTATRRSYAYDFRLAALLLSGWRSSSRPRYASRRCAVSPTVSGLRGAAR